MQKVLVPITDINQIKIGSVIQESKYLRMVLKIETETTSQSNHYYVSYAVHIDDIEQTPTAIISCIELKKIQYLYCAQEFTYPAFNVKRVTFK